MQQPAKRGLTDLQVVGEAQLHDVEIVAVTVLPEDGLYGVADGALRGNGHDLRDLVGKVHLKHVAFLLLENDQVLRER